MRFRAFRNPLFKTALALFFIAVLTSFSPQDRGSLPPYLDMQTPWADSVHAKMSLDEKIGQLFNVAAYSNKGEDHKEEILTLIRDYKIGGLTFFQGGPHRQAKLTNLYQANSSIPLMIAIDGEWGLSMRLDSTMKYPWQMTLGAIQEDTLIYQMAADMAEQFRRLGVHVNFAPVIDVNNNPRNPVINARSFGEDKLNVANKGMAYVNGLQDHGVLATAKHFPGHGDTDADSHLTLPIIKHSKERIDSLELYPFKRSIADGVGSIMSAHLYLPAFTGKNKVASSLSKEVVDTLLHQKLGFQGLTITDGLNMGGVAKYQNSTEIDLQALQAGNDILLLSQDVAASIENIKRAIEAGELDVNQIEEASLKILKAKEWLGLHKEKPIELENLVEDLNDRKYRIVNHQLIKSSLTVLKNKDAILPIKKLDQKMIVVSFSEKEVSYRPFQTFLNRYGKIDTMHYSTFSVKDQKLLMDSLLNYDQIIISVHKSNKSPWVSSKVDNEIKNFTNILRTKKKLILAVFANAYSLNGFTAADYVDGLVLAYQNSIEAQDYTSQLIFGGFDAKGKIPVTVSPQMNSGLGIEIKGLNRLEYVIPESVGLNPDDLAGIDSIIMEGLREKAYPGGQILIARNGKVFMHKAFGKPTYESAKKVKESDLYDIASITKIASSLLAIMDLDGKKKLSLDDKLSKHLKDVKGTDYADITIREMLAHQAGLAAWIPFYIKTLHHGMPNFDIYSKNPSKEFPYQVADKLYISEVYQDSIMHRILKRAKVSPEKEYKYSDVGYYLLREVIEDIVKEPIEEYNEEHFYAPMGMSRTTFRPLNKFDKDEIIPTEMDKIFRRQLVHGYVHDPGAAMQGGVGGHAGLFSNANDLAKLMQMYLQEGEYGDERYLNAEVIKEYRDCQYCKDSIPLTTKDNRRGAGFDKPALHGEPGPTCDCVSFESFGHSGFTGTYAWADPDQQIVYIFLSNRVYPDADNKKLLTLNIRTRIQEKIYEAIDNAKWRNAQSVLNYQP